MASSGPNSPTAAAAIPAPGGMPTIARHYSQKSATRIWGPMTGRPYNFSDALTNQRVRARDANIMAHGGLFYAK
jgi:hypothetical protein